MAVMKRESLLAFNRHEGKEVIFVDQEDDRDGYKIDTTFSGWVAKRDWTVYKNIWEYNPEAPEDVISFCRKCWETTQRPVTKKQKE